MDEIDAIGGSRNPKDQQYMKMTLNQMLVELDGFKQNEVSLLLLQRTSPSRLIKRWYDLVGLIDMLWSLTPMLKDVAKSWKHT